MEAFLSILSREWQDAVISSTGWKVSAGHLIITLLAFLLGWPVSYVLGEAAWAPALVFWLYAEILALSYLALAIPADIFAPTNSIRPGHWILYGNASPLTVHLGQTAATCMALGFWLITATPALLLGLVLRPVPLQALKEIGLFALLLLASMSQVGAWIGASSDSKATRVLLVDVAYLLLTFGTLVVRTTATAKVLAYLGASFLAQVLQPFAGLADKVAKWTEETEGAQDLLAIHPIEIINRVLGVSLRGEISSSGVGNLAGMAASAPSNASLSSAISWMQVLSTYGVILLLAALFSILTLRQWRRRYSSEREDAISGREA